MLFILYVVYFICCLFFSDAFFTELSQRYLRKLKVGAVDIDMFANVVTGEEQLEELQHLLYKLRRTMSTKDTLESTHHAVCRVFLRCNAADRLMDMICDRIGYGIFPDKFCYNMLMDDFIEKKHFKSAAKVASLMMFQEDVGNEISKILGLYSVHMYLRDEQRQDWFDEGQVEITETKSENVDEDDIEYVRVPVIRNPYFDDHFDLKEPNHIIGKTLYYFGKEFDDILGRSYLIYGLVLYEKWKKAIDLLKKFLNNSNDKIILEEIFSKISKFTTELPEDYSNKESVDELMNLLNTMKENGKISDEDLHELMIAKLKNIKDLEQHDISEMPLMFEKWNDAREKALQSQMDKLLIEEKKKEIEEKKKQLAEKERLLFFFESFAKHEIDFTEAEKLIAEMKSKTQVEEEYIPPEV